MTELRSEYAEIKSKKSIFFEVLAGGCERERSRKNFCQCKDFG